MNFSSSIDGLVRAQTKMIVLAAMSSQLIHAVCRVFVVSPTE